MINQNFSTLQILLIIIVPSFFAGLPAMISAIAAWKSNRKRKAEALTDEGTAAEKVSLAWEKLAEDLQKRIDRMDERLNKMQSDTDVRERAWITKQTEMDNKLRHQAKQIRRLMKGIGLLINQIEELGAVPVFKLSDEDLEENNI